MVGKSVTWAIGWPLRRVHFPMRAHNGIVRLDFAAPLPQIIDQLFARAQLVGRRLIAIEVADETDSERDVVEVITVNVAAVDLPPPTIANFNFSVARGTAISNDEVVGETILHSAHVPMIIIEHACIALPCATVVHDDELPATPFHRSAPDRFDD